MTVDVERVRQQIQRGELPARDIRSLVDALRQNITGVGADLSSIDFALSKGDFKRAREAANRLKGHVVSLDLKTTLAMNEVGYDEDELDRTREQLREAREALDQLRSVWNAHMDDCTHDAALQAEIAKMPPLTAEDIRAWRNAPSDTASAELSEKLAPENRTNLGGEWLR